MNGQLAKVYLDEVISKFQTGHAREHAYRPALNAFFEKISGFKVVNDPKRSEYGSPDFVFLKGKITIAYAEAKDIGVSLDETEKGEQIFRYFGYSNLILTDCLEFRFFRNGQKYCEPIKIGEIKNGIINPIVNNFSLAEETIRDFTQEAKEPIKSGAILAKVMAGKARRIRDNINIFLAQSDDIKNKNLLAIYEVVKKLLLADLDKKKFADMYAQTVVYGLFAARYNDETPENFTRGEARDLVPASNPFLREFFDHIAGASFDKRIEFIVNELCEEFTNADVQAIVHNYYKAEKDDSRDPIIHFYEDFLQEYDSSERKKMGVFYTPLPVVRFIVRSIDIILQKDFGLKGLIDSTKIAITRKSAQGGKNVKQQVHKVQILDPATGTGTFLNETISYIKNQFIGQEGRWQSYVCNDLLPRLHGFEIMMASYTIAHLKLSTSIKESGANIDNARLNVFLTNSLEKEDRPDINLFNYHLGLEKAISEESKEANKIKNDLPIMVVLGNPPYNVSSQNKGEWIGELIKDYKKDLGERKINLDDDYIKFIRFSQYLIEKNSEGIIGMITNNSYIDGITHRQMRKKLLETFDDIYILDLHGNSKKKEKAPDGGKDENVFNIQQGVAIVIFVRKSGKRKGLGKVYHSELFGRRVNKFEALDNSDIEKIKWQKIDYKEPYYFFVPKDFGASEGYEKGFKIDELFPISNSGVKTDRDTLFIDIEKDKLGKRIQKLLSGDYDEYFKTEYRVKNSSGYKILEQLGGKIFNGDNLQLIQYRPFDYQWIYYEPGLVSRPAYVAVKHIFKKENLALLTSRSFPANQSFDRALVTKDIPDIHSASDQTYVFPLYLYKDDGSKDPNFKKEIVAEIEKIIGKTTPENIFDYIYAVLHSPSYREKYKEFLKIDFPRVPYPKDGKQFFELVKLGTELRELHLMESKKLDNLITTYPEAGDDKAEKVEYKDGKVYINKIQYFGGVPKDAWEFYIGGYQPAQKWLKDRKGRVLNNTDIEHYQKMVVALTETGNLMEKIDKII